MILSTIKKNGEKIIQGRSEAGKLLFEKTKQGYELKCPRSKKVYLIPYEQMVLDYLTWWDDEMIKRDKGKAASQNAS